MGGNQRAWKSLQTMMQQVCPQVKGSRKEGRNVGWLGEIVLGSPGVRQDHWRVLKPKSFFQGVPHLPEPGLPCTAAELGHWLGAPW